MTLFRRPCSDKILSIMSICSQERPSEKDEYRLMRLIAPEMMLNLSCEDLMSLIFGDSGYLVEWSEAATQVGVSCSAG